MRTHKRTINIFCPSCNNNELIWIGKIPSDNFFAGKILDQPLPGGNLYRCSSCHFYFRWPRLPKAELNELYKEGNPNHWQYEPQNRNDWRLATTWLNSKFSQGTVLDVGCWDGGFLNYLGDTWQSYGIEINKIAIRRAKKRGIYIIEKNFDKLDQILTQFDAVVAFDVIEHTENPRRFLEQLVRLTRTNGFIIISSGNTEALTWKISGSRYWYCVNPEHISFINVAWCYFDVNRLNIQIEYIEKFSHANKNSLAPFLLEVIKNIIYLLIPNLLGKVRRIKNFYLHKKDLCRIYNYPPSWITTKDHLIIIFKKK